MIKKILKKINSRDYTVGIIGLGYVGLPLAWSFYKNGLKIIGFDVYQYNISNLKNGKPFIKLLSQTKKKVDLKIKKKEYKISLSLTDEDKYAVAFVTISL